jgi:hypothetical protein
MDCPEIRTIVFNHTQVFFLNTEEYYIKVSGFTPQELRADVEVRQKGVICHADSKL